jgi:hypothetical protein
VPGIESSKLLHAFRPAGAQAAALAGQVLCVIPVLLGCHDESAAYAGLLLRMLGAPGGGLLMAPVPPCGSPTWAASLLA